MALHDHEIRNDRLGDILSAAGLLGQKPIATAMTWPLAQLKRTFRGAKETLDDAGQDLLEKFTVYELDAAGEPVTDERGNKKPAPVYAFNDDGSPKFKLDKDGKETTEREVKHGSIALTDTLGYEREVRNLMRESVTVRVPHISWAQLQGTLKTCEPNVVEALMEFFDGSPDLEADTERVEAKAERKAAERKGGPRRAVTDD